MYNGPRDPAGNPLDPAARKKENMATIIVVAVFAIVLLLLAIFAPRPAPSGTAEAYYERKAEVNVGATSSAIAESVKEHIRLVALAALPDGYSFVEDFSIASTQWKHKFEYWMLVQDPTWNQAALVFICPSEEDAELMCLYITGHTNTLPELTVTFASPDADANFYLTTP